MDDAEVLLRELRIDWEELVTDNFNPLKQALKNKNSSAEASNFRNLFHRVEKVMESIIEKSYKGFSDSVLSYMESYALNNRCSDSILSISQATEDLLGMQIKVKDMAREYSSAEFFGIKHGLCMVLLEMKSCFNDFCMLKADAEDMETDGKTDMGQRLLDAAKKISRAYELIDKNKLMTIECVEKFREEMDAELAEFVRLVCKRLDLFVFQNRGEYQQDFRCIAVLNRLGDLERHQADSFEREYSRMIETAIREVGKKDNQLETLIRTVMGKSQVVVRNFDSLWEMADAVFDGLHSRAENFFGEEKSVFRIYSPDGRSLVESIIQGVLERFVQEYTESLERHSSKEEFRAEDFFDDIDYTSVFESKYLIHEKMACASKCPAAVSGSFTKICSPSIEAAIYMRKYAFSSAMKTHLDGLLREKYIREKEAQLKKRVMYLFDEEWHRSNYSRRRLSFYPEYERAVSEFSQHPELCNISSVSDLLGDIVSKRFSMFFDRMFRSPIIRESLSDTSLTEDGQIDAFKRLLPVRVIDKSTLFLQRQRYENAFFAVETLEEMSRSLNSQAVRDVRDKISAGLTLQVFLEIFYFFDLFYREGNYVCENDYYLHKILGVVEDVYESAADIAGQHRHFGSLFECLNFYIRKNVVRLNVRSLDELNAFSGKIRLLDEILSLIESEESLRSAVDFIQDAVSMTDNSEEAAALRAKIRMHD